MARVLPIVVSFNGHDGDAKPVIVSASGAAIGSKAFVDQMIGGFIERHSEPLPYDENAGVPMGTEG